MKISKKKDILKKIKMPKKTHKIYKKMKGLGITKNLYPRDKYANSYTSSNVKYSNLRSKYSYLKVKDISQKSNL
jgi:hypothetical protein